MKSGEIVSCIQILIGGGDIALMTWRTMSLPIVCILDVFRFPLKAGVEATCRGGYGLPASLVSCNHVSNAYQADHY